MNTVILQVSNVLLTASRDLLLGVLFALLLLYAGFLRLSLMQEVPQQVERPAEVTTPRPPPKRNPEAALTIGAVLKDVTAKRQRNFPLRL